jgi:hypothetical protein
MKKTISALISASLMAMVLTPMLALAQNAPSDSCTLRHDITIGTETYAQDTKLDASVTLKWGLYCFLDAVETVIDWIFFFLVAVASFLVIYGGFSIATSSGDEHKFKQGRDYILFAMIGLAVALLSKAVPALVRALVGG